MSNFDSEHSELTPETFDKYLTIRETRFSIPEDIKSRIFEERKEAPFAIDKDFVLHILSYGYHGDLRQRARITPEDEIEVGRLQLESGSQNQVVALFNDKLMNFLNSDKVLVRKFHNIIIKRLENYLNINIVVK